MRKSGIEPFIQLYTARFIPLFIHLTLLILVFVFRDSLIKTCSTTSPPEIWLDAWTGVSLGLVIIEMILSLSGISIFRKYSIFFSIVLHSTASILLAMYFMSDENLCIGLPYLLFFCTLIPLAIEIFGWIETFLLKKTI